MAICNSKVKKYNKSPFQFTNPYDRISWFWFPNVSAIVNRIQDE
jgi:hypothetical protein